jgi:mono/diheme cytochrome c family protein
VELTQPVAIALIIAILVVAAIAVPWFLTRGARSQRRRYEDVPPGLRPAYSDEQLEKTVIERYMGWGAVLTLFFAVFFPVYWVAESNRIRNAEAGLFTSSVASGEALYQANCSECHGANAGGAATASPYSEGGSWPAPSLVNIVERYEANPNVDDIRDYITQAIKRGRPGTPMPPWSQAFQGPLTDQEVFDIVDWILVNQIDGQAEEVSSTDMSAEELFAQNCANCHGEDGGGQVGPTLVGVFERHDEDTVLGILRNGIFLSDGLSMPPWQNGYMYEDTRYDDETLQRMVDYLEELQPDELPEDADKYQTPGVRPDDADDEGEDDEDATTARANR